MVNLQCTLRVLDVLMVIVPWMTTGSIYNGNQRNSGEDYGKNSITKQSNFAFVAAQAPVVLHN